MAYAAHYLQKFLGCSANKCHEDLLHVDRASFHWQQRKKQVSGQKAVRNTKPRATLPAAVAVMAENIEAVEQPTSAETARTIVEVMAHGTLATLNEDGCPLGTYTSYVLDQDGQPLLRLRADAVHKRNLLRQPRCSLFIQPQDLPARLLARVTLIGKAESVDAETAAQAAELHRQVAGGGVGVDAPQDSDEFFRLSIDHCFYVGGMGTASQAEVISKDDFGRQGLLAAWCSLATPDILRNAAPKLAAFFNQDRADDVRRIAAHASDTPFEQLYASELVWVDRLGAYVSATQYNSERQIHRVKFHRPVVDERDARSMLTMLAQYSWEQERNYCPPVPETIAM